MNQKIVQLIDEVLREESHWPECAEKLKEAKLLAQGAGGEVVQQMLAVLYDVDGTKTLTPTQWMKRCFINCNIDYDTFLTYVEKLLKGGLVQVVHAEDGDIQGYYLNDPGHWSSDEC